MPNIIIRIVRHYRPWDGTIACGSTSTRIDTTAVVKGVTCKRCLVWLKKAGLIN